MSECVVRMRIPSNCERCPMCGTASGGNGMYKLWCMCGDIPASSQRRPDDCPILCQLPEGHGRLVDADAYSAEMKDRQDAAWKWRNEAIAEEDELKLARAEGAFTAFTEAKLTMEKAHYQPVHRVEDGLPKEVGSYLTAYYDGFVCENQLHYIGPTAIGWVNDAEAVRYFMPLPEPPKEDA